MKPRELLNDFVFFLLSDRLLGLHCDPSRLDATPSGLDLSVSCEYRMWVPVKGIPTLKKIKRAFGTGRCTVIMTYLIFRMYAIYIILMDLPYWTGLVKLITLKSILPSS